MIPITELLLGNSIRTTKSNVLLEDIDRAEFDQWGKLRIHGYIKFHQFSNSAVNDRWTILDPNDIDLTN
jgi:hypothetical protein